MHAQNSPGVATGAFAGKLPPQDSGHGLHIRAYPGGYVLLHSPYLQFHASSAVYGEDPCAYLVVAGSTLVARNKGGIWSARPWDRVLGQPHFLGNSGLSELNIATFATVKAAAGARAHGYTPCP